MNKAFGSDFNLRQTGVFAMVKIELNKLSYFLSNSKFQLCLGMLWQSTMSE